MAQYLSESSTIRYAWEKSTQRGLRSQGAIIKVTTEFDDSTGEATVKRVSDGEVVATKDKYGTWTIPPEIEKDLPGFTQNLAQPDSTLKRNFNNQIRQGIQQTLQNQGKALSSGNSGAINGKLNDNSETPNGADNGRQGSTSPTSGPVGINTAQTAMRAFATAAESMGRKGYGDLYYPDDLQSSGMDFMSYTQFRHRANSKLNNMATSGAGSFDIGRSTERYRDKKNIGSVSVPIQGSLKSVDKVGWGPNSLNAFQAFGAAALTDIMKSGGDIGTALGRQLDAMVDATGQNKEELKATLTAAIAQKIVGGGRLLTRGTGAVINPNLELLFNGPELRNFSFSIRLSPRNEPETKLCQKIIRFFKQGMSVKATQNALFLQSPNVFKIQYQHSTPTKTGEGGEVSGDHPFMNKFKMASLVNFTVDYAPDGSYMTYENGSMVAYDLGLSFTEIEPVYDSDYDQFGNDHIGF